MSVRLTLLSALLACPAIAGAQAASSPLKRALLPPVSKPACAVATTRQSQPSDDQRSRARALASSGQQAALLGDTATAVADLRQAATLDPLDPDLAYRLGRAYESGRATTRAVSEYCRFIALAPTSADASDARQRVSILATPVPDSSITDANTLFQNALEAYDAGHFADADAKFTSAIAAHPSWADAYFDRAFARWENNQRSEAASDFDAYLRANPAAEDRASVTDRIARLRSRRSAGTAFGIGLIPGAGQFYTRQPVFGTIVAAATGSLIAFAIQSKTTTTTSQQTATDPFGNPYTYTATLRTTDRPNLTAGAVAAGAVTIVAAIQAAIYASHGETFTPSRVSLDLGPIRSGLGLRVSF